MNKEMIINAVVSDNVRVAILENGRLTAFFEELAMDHRVRSNVYLGRIINIEASLDACFVDYGGERHGFLPFSEIVPAVYANKPQKGNPARIDQVMRSGQLVVVQADKEASGTKGARLTTDISLAGRFMVFMPFNDTRGVSRKISEPEARKECRDVADKMDPPKGTGVIIRTAGLGQGKRALVRDLNFLIRLWGDIQLKAKKTNRTLLLHAEADLVQRIIRDYFTTDIQQIWIDDREAFDKSESFFKLLMPRQSEALKAYTDKIPIFTNFGVEAQIEEIHARRVALPSGGSLVIDQTEALVAIDVNSGKMKGRSNQESTAYETNLEAAIEIARQLTLRDMGGIVVIDFIDMTSGAHKSEVEKALKTALKTGKARNRIGKISAFGLCTLTRQRLGKSLPSLGQRECPTCSGSGLVPDLNLLGLGLLRKVRTAAATGQVAVVRLRLPVEVADHFQNHHRHEILSIERDWDLRIQIESSLEFELAKVELLTEARPAGSATAPERKDEPTREPHARPAGSATAPERKDEPIREPNARPNRRRRRRKKKPSGSAEQDSARSMAEAPVEPATEKKSEADPSSGSEVEQPEGRESKPETKRPSIPKKAGRKPRRPRSKVSKPEQTEKSAETDQTDTSSKPAAEDGAQTPPEKKKRRRRRRRKKPESAKGDTAAKEPAAE